MATTLGLFRGTLQLLLRSPIRTTTRLLTTSRGQEQVPLYISNDGLKLHWRDPHSTTANRVYHAKWLRHHCQCSECTASTGQRIVPLDILKGNVLLNDANIQDDTIQLSWCTNNTLTHSGHVSTEWLRDNDYSRQALDARNIAMEPSIARSLPSMEYEEVMTSDEGLWRWLYSLNDKGMCVLTKGPIADHRALRKVGERISYIQKTIYGEFFDVTASPTPINIAYTNTSLDTHMDLVYYQSPPGLQFLHCVKRDSCVQGGMSVLVDTLPVVNELREKYPQHFETLSKVPATFQKIHMERDDPVMIIRHQPHIELDRNGRVVRVNWAPAFEGPLNIDESQVDDYYEAYCTFHQAIDDSPYKLEHCLEPGEILTFNNQRVLHGRDEVILNGGKRHLIGCYINIDEFYSKLNVLSKQLEKKEVTKHVFNGSYYL